MSKNTARVHPGGNIGDHFASFASPFVRNSFSYCRIAAGWSILEDPTGRGSLLGLIGRWYRFMLPIITFGCAVLITSVYVADRGGAYRAANLIWLVSMLFCVVSVRLASFRGAMYEALLYELEHKAINDLQHFRKVKQKTNHAHHGLVLSTKGYLTTTSLSNLDDMDSAADDLEKGGGEDVVGVVGAQDEESLMKEFFGPLNIPTYIGCTSALVGIMTRFTTASDPSLPSEVRALMLVLGVCFILFFFGEGVYGFILILRWINVAIHGIECWGYSVVELVDKSTSPGGVSESHMLGFRAKLDALHDMHAVPLAFLNQKMSTAISLLVSF